MKEKWNKTTVILLAFFSIFISLAFYLKICKMILLKTVKKLTGDDFKFFSLFIAQNPVKIFDVQ